MIQYEKFISSFGLFSLFNRFVFFQSFNWFEWRDDEEETWRSCLLCCSSYSYKSTVGLCYLLSVSFRYFIIMLIGLAAKFAVKLELLKFWFFLVLILTKWIGSMGRQIKYTKRPQSHSCREHMKSIKAFTLFKLYTKQLDSKCD